MKALAMYFYKHTVKNHNDSWTNVLRNDTKHMSADCQHNYVIIVQVFTQ